MASQVQSLSWTNAGAQQPWIHSAPVDLLFILSPSLIACLLAWLLSMSGTNTLPVWGWVVLVLGIDVAHVYGTVFRTYLHREIWQRRSGLLITIPLACWLAGVLLYSVDGLLFWRVLAYVAVFHFIRQQYGFLAIYSRPVDGMSPKGSRWQDMWILYLSMLYPIAWWHTHQPQSFNWFVESDFLTVPSWLSWVDEALGVAFILSALIYAVSETRWSLSNRQFNWPKNLLILGTALSWNLGIVLFASDVAFTLTNIVSHGVPYIALSWLDGQKLSQTNVQPFRGQRLPWKRIFTAIGIPFILALLWLIAYLEEGLWDAFVWRDHAEVFGLFAQLPHIADPATLAWLVPLLTVPQATHYILDGLVWRKSWGLNGILSR